MLEQESTERTMSIKPKLIDVWRTKSGMVCIRFNVPKGTTILTKEDSAAMTETLNIIRDAEENHGGFENCIERSST